MISERDDLLKQLTRLQSKETQYRHDLRNRDLQITKLQETIKQKLFGDKAGTGRVDLVSPAGANPEFRFNKISPDSDF